VAIELPEPVERRQQAIKTKAVNRVPSTPVAEANQMTPPATLLLANNLAKIPTIVKINTNIATDGWSIPPVTTCQYSFQSLARNAVKITPIKVNPKTTDMEPTLMILIHKSGTMKNTRGKRQNQRVMRNSNNCGDSKLFSLADIINLLF
jgi:hypothetical protein